jgi:predicted PolB exonuclease-like 3'-5' exonuclease
MNPRIRKINLEQLVFFDIETVRVEDNIDVNSALYKTFRYKNRNKEDNSLLPEKEVLELFNKRAALSPVYGKIVCISVAIIRGREVHFKSYTGNEHEIIKAFFDIWTKKPESIPCGHNIVKFDIPFLRLRASIYGESIPDRFNDSESKPWVLAEDVVDTMEVVSGCFISNLSLEEVCTLYGIESPKNVMDGSMVSGVFYKEGVKNIATYCERDVIALVEVMNKISGANLELTYATKEDSNAPIYEKLKKAKKLTVKLIKDLEEFKAKYVGREKDFDKIRILMAAATETGPIKDYIKTY